MGTTHKFTAAGVAAYVLIRSLSAWSADDATQTTQVPPTFNIAGGGQLASTMGAMMNSCLSNVTGDLTSGIQQIGDLLQGKKGGGSSNGGCGTDDASSTSLSCRNVANEDVLDKLVDRKKKELASVEAAINCKKNKFDNVYSQISCLTQQAQTLSNQIGMLQKGFEENIQRMQSDVAQIKAAQEDRKEQAADVTRRLAGDPSTGSKGLLKLKDMTQAAVNGAMPQQILAVKEGFKEVDTYRKGLEEMIQVKMITQTNDCFNTRTSPEFQCVPNGPPVSIRDYVLCRYEQNQQLGTNGNIERGSLVERQARANAAGLAAILNSILNDSGKTVNVDPSNPKAAQDALNRAVTVLNPDDIEKQFGAQLTKFNGKGLNIHDFVMGQINGCYSRAQTVVARERRMASSDIGVRTETLNKKERAVQDSVNQFVESFSQLFDENMAGLTGTHMPINSSACKNASPAIQTNCLEDLRKNMEGILNGNVPQSAVNLQIKGTNAATYIPVTCQGLSGCVTSLQAVSTNVQREIKRLDQFKKDYALKAKQNAETFAQQMAQMLSPQSQALQSRLKDMNKLLASLGVSPLRPKPLQGEPLEVDADGVPKSPKSILAFVGAKLNPPLIDVQGDAFSEGLSGVSEAQSRLDEKRTRLAQAYEKLDSERESCLASVQEKNLNSVDANLDQIRACLGTQEGCQAIRKDQTTQNALGKLFESLRELDSSLYPDGANPADALESGMGACQGEGDGSFDSLLKAVKAADDEVKAQETELARLRKILKDETAKKPPSEAAVKLAKDTLDAAVPELAEKQGRLTAAKAAMTEQGGFKTGQSGAACGRLGSMATRASRAANRIGSSSKKGDDSDSDSDSGSGSSSSSGRGSNRGN